MDEFICKTYDFNKYGETPVDDSYSNLVAALNLIKSEVKELEDNLDAYSFSSKMDSTRKKEELQAAMMDDVADIIVTAVGLAYRMGKDEKQVKAVLDIVSDANLSKFPISEMEAQKSVEAYQNDDRYENVSYKKVADDRYVVFGSPAGTSQYKILKRVGWVDPQQRIEAISKYGMWR